VYFKRTAETFCRISFVPGFNESGANKKRVRYLEPV
jgi:hypothetical protein